MDSKASDSTVTTIGINIGKNTFHLVGLDEGASPGRLCCGGSFRPGQVAVRLANMPPRLIGMGPASAPII